jgi:hypothetical protein
VGDAQKQNTLQTRKVLQQFLTVVSQNEALTQTEQSVAPTIPEPVGTALGDLKNSIGIFGKGNSLNIAYIVSLVLQLTSQESLELAKEQQLQVEANQLQYNAGVAAADDAAAAAIASGAASFTGAGLSLASLGFDAVGSFRSFKAANAEVKSLTPQEESTSSLAKEDSKSFSETSEGIELQSLNSSKSSRASSPSTASESEVQSETQNLNAATSETSEGDLSKASARRTQANVNRTLETQQQNAEQETSFNSREEVEGPNSRRTAVNQRQNVAATNEAESAEGKVDLSSEQLSKEVRSNARPADPEADQRVGDSQENRVNEENKADKAPPKQSEVEKLVKDLRSAIKPDVKEKVTEFQKQEAWNKAYDRNNAKYQRVSHALNAGAQATQGIGAILQGNATRAQLIAQAQAQLQGATSQAAGQTVQQLQEVINNARNIVNGLLQSEFSVSRSA